MAKPAPPDLPRLKRFANLDIDGVSRPPKPAPKAAPTVSARAAGPSRPSAPPAQDVDERAARSLASELSDNARTSIANTRPEAMRASRAADLRRGRPPDPVPTPANRRAGFELRVREPMPMPPSRDFDEELFPPDALRTPGVLTLEIGARRAAPAVRASSPRDVSDRYQPLPAYAPRGRPAAPIEVTPLAARQILLLAWQSGMQGSGLRIFMTRVPDLGGPELDFAFDDHPTPDDVVFESNGVRVLCDPETLAWARGRRITFHDVPTETGIGAFRLA